MFAHISKCWMYIYVYCTRTHTLCVDGIVGLGPRGPQSHALLFLIFQMSTYICFITFLNVSDVHIYCLMCNVQFPTFIMYLCQLKYRSTTVCFERKNVLEKIPTIVLGQLSLFFLDIARISSYHHHLSLVLIPNPTLIIA